MRTSERKQQTPFTMRSDALYQDPTSRAFEAQQKCALESA